ncbi:hypothetical protein GGI02_001854 [Coemansia sp. RSA 2322]|uniref:Uncharacterized protein n=1 Tax=Coemansia thaxteri TaxID=2663907 RepID=A0A9W8BFY0_9FUNG|nr:hypothetical protein H4R26_001887 [Coemansia thaxteri]KAJ2472047.1 hypothetical protein GGI02_001854 [Coemansia sp. RSA 2322]KAJ2484002.1 hypothetical protein EV174_002792 [Coemansia sp. RSA 2320]
MKLALITSSIVTIVSGVMATPNGLNIPGILNLDLGHGNGLELNVLGGLIHANIGGRGQRASKPATQSAAPLATASPVPAPPAIHFF